MGKYEMPADEAKKAIAELVGHPEESRWGFLVAMVRSLREDKDAAEKRLEDVKEGVVAALAREKFLK